MLDSNGLQRAIAEAAREAAGLPHPLAFLIVVGHDDIAGATSATTAALAATGTPPTIVKVVERPGRLYDHPLMPDAPSVATVVADARRGRRHQIQGALWTLATKLSLPGKRIIALTVHADAETMAQIVHDAVGSAPLAIIDPRRTRRDEWTY